MTWLQNYDPLHSVALSTAVAVSPIVVLLSAIGVFKVALAALVVMLVSLQAYVFPFSEVVVK
jgi:hypothetical protein